MALPDAAPVDGRMARGLRTRTVVIDALLDLLERGLLRPTTAEIAERAGVSERTVFQHFADLDALFAEVADRQIERVSGEVPRLLQGGPVAPRIAAFVTRRAALYERIAPVRRAALLQEPFSAAVAQRLVWLRRRLRAETSLAFAPELARQTAAARRASLDALGAATSWSAWEALRRHAGLSRSRSERALTRSISALVAPSGRRAA